MFWGIFVLGLIIGGFLLWIIGRQTGKSWEDEDRK
jgi:hypothetical protein